MLPRNILSSGTRRGAIGICAICPIGKNIMADFRCQGQSLRLGLSLAEEGSFTSAERWVVNTCQQEGLRVAKGLGAARPARRW